MTALKPERGWRGWIDRNGKAVFVHWPERRAMGLRAAIRAGILDDVRKARHQIIAQACAGAKICDVTWYAYRKAVPHLHKETRKALIGYLLE